LSDPDGDDGQTFRETGVRRLGIVVGMALGASGCASWLELVLPEPEPPTPARPAESPSDPSRVALSRLGAPAMGTDDSVVRILAGGVACSGTLIAEDRVLTAHHCVARRNGEGHILARDVPPGEIRIELGGDFLPWGEVGVRELIAPECGYAAGVGDIAILVLERPLPGAAALSVRLDTPPKPSEVITPVGFGRCATSAEGIRRRTRPSERIDVVASMGFQLDAAICPGDSGGPALDRRGAVVGIISASAMDGSEATRERTEFTRLDVWRAVFAVAERVAEGVALAELPPIDGCQ
jgi:hypothetical protein